MRTKQHVLLTSILVTLVCIILYEAGVFKVEAPKELFADDTQKAFILKNNEESVVIPPGTKMNVAWNSSEEELNQTGVVVYKTIDTSLIYVMSSSNQVTIPVDQIQQLIVHKGSKTGKYAKNGFLIGGAIGAFFGLTAALDNDGSEDSGGNVLGFTLCGGLSCGLPGGLIGAIAGSATKNNITYPISPNDWEIVIE